MTDSERAVFEAAVEYVIWCNKVPQPRDYADIEEQLRDVLSAKVVEHLGPDRWWVETCRTEGWSA